MVDQNTKAHAQPHDQDLVNSNVIFIGQDMLMQEAVQLMIDKKISSLLVIDHEETVVGILTERDIVRKFTLLDMQDKLTRTVMTLMTRPVMFAHVSTLKKDITSLHLDYKIRHFPVVTGNGNKKENVVGIVSITDLARQALSIENHTDAGSTSSEARIKIGIITNHKGNLQVYLDLFRGMGFDSNEISDYGKYLSRPEAAKEACIFDMDGYTDQKLHDMIPVIVKSKSFLIMTTSNPNLVPIFKKYLNKERQEIAMKPLDMGYISWILSKKWSLDKRERRKIGVS
jgi:CBS domain-containing protein